MHVILLFCGRNHTLAAVTEWACLGTPNFKEPYLLIRERNDRIMSTRAGDLKSIDLSLPFLGSRVGRTIVLTLGQAKCGTPPVIGTVPVNPAQQRPCLRVKIETIIHSYNSAGSSMGLLNCTKVSFWSSVMSTAPHLNDRRFIHRLTTHRGSLQTSSPGLRSVSV